MMNPQQARNLNKQIAELGVAEYFESLYQDILSDSITAKVYNSPRFVYFDENIDSAFEMFRNGFLTGIVAHINEKGVYDAIQNES